MRDLRRHSAPPICTLETRRCNSAMRVQSTATRMRTRYTGPTSEDPRAAFTHAGLPDFDLRMQQPHTNGAVRPTCDELLHRFHTSRPTRRPHPLWLVSGTAPPAAPPRPAGSTALPRRRLACGFSDVGPACVNAACEFLYVEPVYRMRMRVAVDWTHIAELHQQVSSAQIRGAECRRRSCKQKPAIT